jgi:DNA-binding transcriptional LysR family regulator
MAFHVATGVASAIYRGLMERTIEVAITRVSGPVDEEVLRVETLFDDVLVVAAGARNPWTRRRRIALADLVNERWVLPLPDSLTTALAMEAFRASGLELPRATVVTPSLSMRNRLLTTGGFLTAIHGFALAVPGTSPMIRPLPVAMPNSRRPIALITLKKRALSPLAEYFMDNMRAIAKPFAKGEAAPGKARPI